MLAERRFVFAPRSIRASRCLLSTAEKRAAIDRVRDSTAKRFKVMMLTDAPIAISVQKEEIALTQATGRRAGVLDTRQAQHKLIEASTKLARTLGMVATEAEVASATSGVGLVILAIGIAAIVVANLLERDSLERWAGGCYFGNDSDPKLHYKTSVQEAAALDAVFWEAENNSEQDKVGRLHPMPPGSPGTLGPPNATVENGD